ncbi:hypothetical protein CBL_09861 [Carabus blaptoides fortunei]
MRYTYGGNKDIPLYTEQRPKIQCDGKRFLKPGLACLVNVCICKNKPASKQLLNGVTGASRCQLIIDSCSFRLAARALCCIHLHKQKILVGEFSTESATVPASAVKQTKGGAGYLGLTPDQIVI